MFNNYNDFSFFEQPVNKQKTCQSFKTGRYLKKFYNKCVKL